MMHHNQINESEGVEGCYYPAIIAFALVVLLSVGCALASVGSLLQ